MPKPSEIRTELLGQHADLRAKMKAARELANRCHHEDAREALRDSLSRVADALRMHNKREEELMRDVFPELDAWGPIRAEIMAEEHVGEHNHLYEALMTASTTAVAKEAASAAMTLFDQIEKHMAREEKVFLGEDVLSDDGVIPDMFGG